jgi:hypothetical protein
MTNFWTLVIGLLRRIGRASVAGEAILIPIRAKRI